jgi:hypothetical protein
MECCEGAALAQQAQPELAEKLWHVDAKDSEINYQDDCHDKERYECLARTAMAALAQQAKPEMPTRPERCPVCMFRHNADSTLDDALSLRKYYPTQQAQPRCEHNMATWHYLGEESGKAIHPLEVCAGPVVAPQPEDTHDD